jgi:hypothetical protein
MILKYNKFLESKGITKEELIDKIKFYSSYIENFMKDINKYTTSNLNFSFTYYKLDINQVFKLTNELDYESNDGTIRAICNELIQWGNYFKSSCEPSYSGSHYKRRYNKEFTFDYDYSNYSDEYKLENKRVLYEQLVLFNNYYYVGKKLEELIKGTTWDIPEITDFTEDDRELIKNCLVNEYEINQEDINEKGFIRFTNSKRLLIDIDDSFINNDTDFVDRLQYYFKGLIVLKSWDGTSIYLPFKK